MRVTSNSLFHFTTSLKKLEGIITDKFRIYSCVEKYKLDYENHTTAVPMVSFCDIPLSLAKNHLDSYGKYAIGLTKEWGINNGLNPTLYLQGDSTLSKDIQKTLDHLMGAFRPIRKDILREVAALQSVSNIIRVAFKPIPGTDKFKMSDDDTANVIAILNSVSESLREQTDRVSDAGVKANATLGIFRFIKNYEGELIRKNKTFKNYRFYDEREWRYAPLLENTPEGKEHSALFKQYRSEGGAKPYLKTHRLKFVGSDIKYLLVKSAKDIPKLIEVIRTTKNLVENAHDAEILSTKIITVEQLQEDF